MDLIVESPPTSDDTTSPSSSLAHRAALASIQARTRHPDRPAHLSTSQPIDYDDDELRFLKAVQEFKVRHGLSFLTASQYFRVFKALGYRRRS